MDIWTDWGERKKTPLQGFPQEVIKNIAHKLFFDTPNIGRKVSPMSIVKGYTEY